MVGIDTSAEGWKLRVVPDAATMSEEAAKIVADVIRDNPNAAISLPTGSTPLGMFDLLAQRASRNEIDFSAVELFCLDEYVGVAPSDPNSLTGWLQKEFIAPVGIPQENVHTLPAIAADPAQGAAEYERELPALGGLDLVVLGLGPNGHIAYNEPGSPAASRTRVVALTPESVAQASAYWHDTVSIPDQALTMGVGTILEAERIVLLVTGEGKADILRRALEEPMDASVPASWLRLAGPRLEIVADEAAAADLSID